MTILYVFPSKNIVKLLLESKKSFSSCHEDGTFYVYENGTKKSILYIKDKNISMHIKFTEMILKELDSFSPIFSRWIHKGHRYENLKEKYVFKISRIINFIQQYGIKKGFFCTAVSHHLDIFCYELAFKVLNLDQIFLYPLFPKFETRLIPFIQRNGFQSRYRLENKVSKFSFGKLMMNLEETKNATNPINFRQTIFNNIKTNLFLSLIYLIIRKIKKTTQFFLHYLSIKTIPLHLLENYSETFFSDFEMVFSQNKYLKLYKYQSKFFKRPLNKKVSLLIAAHFQPEATSFPESGRVYSHLYIISHLRNIGVKGKIFYKEHFGSFYFIEGGQTQLFVTGPTRVGMNRDINYLKELIKMNCSFLPIDSDLSSFDDFLPITLSGSIAVERSLRGLHTLYTGKAWWDGLPGTINLYDNNFDLNNIPINLVTPNAELASKAKEFILDILDYKTLSNKISVGILENHTINSVFREEFMNLIDTLD